MYINSEQICEYLGRVSYYNILQAFVSCGKGVHMVGYVLICDGVCDSICSIGLTPFVKIVGRVPIFTMAAIVNVVAIVFMFHWMPHPDQTALFFLVPALWGIADSVWQTQINGKATLREEQFFKLIVSINWIIIYQSVLSKYPQQQSLETNLSRKGETLYNIAPMRHIVIRSHITCA